MPAPQPGETLDGQGEIGARAKSGREQATVLFRALFADLANLTQRVKEKLSTYGEVLDPQGKKWGSDFTKDDHYAEVLEGIRVRDVLWTHLSPPCRTFWPAGKEGGHGTAKVLRTPGRPEGFGDAAAETGNLLADRSAAIGEMQVARERYVSVEHPWESLMWELKPLKRLRKRKGMVLLRFDRCANKEPHTEPTGILTNCPWLVKAAKLGSKTAEYPVGTYDQWAEAFREWAASQETLGPRSYVQKGAYTNKLLQCELGPDAKKRRAGQVSAKEEREQENEECIGGMRNPHHAVAKNSGWVSWGRAARAALDEVLQLHPEVLRLVDRLGTEMSDTEVTRLQEQLHAAGTAGAERLAELLHMKKEEGSREGPTGWRCSLMSAITTQVNDADVDVAGWLGGATPLGITKSIPPRGIFPPAGPTKAQLESAEFMAQRAGVVEVERNYKSFEENKEGSKKEMARLEAEGHLERIGDWHQVRRRWPKAIATRVATLVKQKSDGSQKVRFIVDMLRSGVNSLAVAGERIVLPRATDLINSTLDLWESAKRGESLEFLTIDIADAFLNLQIEDEERANTIIRAQEGDYLVYKGVPFGLATAPLLWGRVAAWLGRATQSIFERGQVRTQTYVDDPVLIARGYRDARRWYFARALLLWAALGARLALKKASKGSRVTWIGAQYEVLPQGIRVGIDQQRISKLQEAMASINSGKGLVSLRSLTGELSWVAGLVPKIRPWVTMLWAACHASDMQHLAKQGRDHETQFSSTWCPNHCSGCRPS